MTGAAAAIRDRIRELGQASSWGTSDAAERTADRLGAYLELLLEASRRMNLVSAADARPGALVERHLADSLSGLPFLPAPGSRKLRLLDIGTGGGFPAIPLLIVRQDVEGVLVESTAKKCRFLSAAVRTLSLTAEIVNARFPHSIPMSPPARFDILTSRAVADAAELLRRARPLLAPGARALFWTTEPLFEELRKAGVAGDCRFQRAAGAETRGIALLERFT